ncbi:MAG: rubredoxin [Desulfobacula sp.]|jgi:rubredoxin|uniref:rubredoxin-like domain-containing protein n=1 Tax=Desulfobacula sp. TaxID=2593537 RepID=UPI001D77F349|nr:rubredoxin [Desulfobacula sp.]MBT3484725.1 rubredoxin [Desulfobacula sp.]MBT3804355.1 rubredoxin [Desulfobacula sp.]MBT4025146.1 rubredoxin [Desulfobacula sp.]MBT4198548.1 rubredoxin [Desulfobacula sp.]
MKTWQCSVCKYIHKGEAPPEKCPICGVDASKFVEINIEPQEKKTGEKKTTEVKPGTTPFKEKSKAKPGTEKKIEKPVPAVKEKGIEKIYSLIVKHHAHPVLVHTPNGILPAAVILFLLAWIFDYPFLSKVAFVNLIFVILALPLVIYTGIVEWKKKYNSAMTIIFKLKIMAASITLVSCMISFVWFLLDPAILSSPKSLVFIFINIIMLAAAGIAGHIGGKLVFKD